MKPWATLIAAMALGFLWGLAAASTALGPAPPAVVIRSWV